MKQKLLKLVIVTMLFLMVAVTGCTNSNQEKDVDTGSQQEDNNVTKEPGEEVTDDSKEKVEEETDDTKEKVEEEIDEKEEQEEVENENASGVKDVYEEMGLAAGTCLSDRMIMQSKYANIITENFNQITLENHMKPDYILDHGKSMATGELTVSFSKSTTDLLDWAKANDMKVRGHVLVWYSQTPDWIFYEDFNKANGLVDRETMLARMEHYIKQTFDLLTELGYIDIFYSYDIVNEAILDDGSYRDCLWKQIIGDDYIWYSFYYADQYAPEHIRLYYNDFNEQFKTDAVVKMAKTLVDEDGRYLIDGIGCQGHLYTKDSIDDYMETLRAFSEIGLDVQITELDVSLGTWMQIDQPTEENLKEQGRYYYELVNRIVEENKEGTTNVSAITFWGFSDDLSWRNNRSPLLFNRNLDPKYAFFGAIQDYERAGY